MIGQHLMLKAMSLGLTTPFFSASLIETVQSDIACEKPGIFDIFKVIVTPLVNVHAGEFYTLGLFRVI